MAKKKTAKKDIKKYLKCIIPVITAILCALGITIAIKTNENGGFQVTIEYSPEAVITGDEGEYEEVATIEEIDGGGKFQDIIGDTDATGLYYELGAVEDADTSSPEAFKKTTLGRCLIAGNYWGAQCVSLSRVFWQKYAGFDVSTCGTGLAKGMMNCWEDNARDKFKTIWNTNEIQDGTWIVLDGNTTGHICMALGKVVNGYVSCLGENQGGAICEGVGGSATNIINISVKNFIGGYTPLTYIPPEPEPEPEPLSPDTGIVK